MARSRPSRRLRASVALTSAALLLSACSATNPITSQQAYDPSDGVGVEFGTISAENLLLVAAAAGEPGALQGSVANRGDGPAVVQLATGSDSAELVLAAGELLLLGGSHGVEVLLITPDAPGATTDLRLTTSTSGRQTVPVPVLDGTLPEYTDLVPTPADDA